MSEKLTYKQKIIECGIEKVLDEHFCTDFVKLCFEWWSEWSVFIKLLGIKGGKLQHLYLCIKKEDVFELSDEGLLEMIKKAEEEHSINLDCIRKSTK